MTKILILAASLHGGGAEYVARTWATKLTEYGHEVDFAITGGVRGNPDVAVPMAVRSIPGSNIASKSRNLASMLRQGDYDSLISLQTYPNLVAILGARLTAARSRPRVFVSERNLVSLGMRGARLGHKAKIRVARSLYRLADGVIAISHPVAAELVSWFNVDGDKCVVVPNPAAAKTEPIRKKRISPPNRAQPLYLVLPARLVEQKQPLLAIRAAQRLRQRGLDVRVVSFGTGDLSRQVVALAEQCQVPLRIAGWVENWCRGLPPNSVALLTSKREGFGNVLLEAASVGVPSVALSGALGTADAILPGITGELAFSSEVDVIADAIERCFLLKPLDVSAWIDRFTAESSARALERFILRSAT